MKEKMNLAKPDQDKEYYSGCLYDEQNFLSFVWQKYSFREFPLPMNMLKPLKNFRQKEL